MLIALFIIPYLCYCNRLIIRYGTQVTQDRTHNTPMAQFKKTKKGPLMSVTIPKLDTKQGKKLNELSVRAGAISRAIPPPENAKKKESTQPGNYTNHPCVDKSWTIL